mmetsp:Transcript_10446/g.33769  ORF Transcript_10446/g.33769 Transcript_10446/m.33769 type:complete len:284 (-) Transcript_10446:402-1253(-)
MVRLTEKLVLAKTRAGALSDVRNLNLWGAPGPRGRLMLTFCPRLIDAILARRPALAPTCQGAGCKMLRCVRAGNDITDVSVLANMKNVEVLSLSVNKIASLQYFAQCPKLQELYLRKNEVADLGELRHLVSLPALQVLWLSDNPCAGTEGYRKTVIRSLPRLKKLDNEDITAEERAAAGLPPHSEPVGSPAPLPRALSGASPSPLAAAAPAMPPSPSPAALATPDPPPRPPLPAPPSTPAPGGTPKKASSNVLYAVMALLGDLDDDGLRIVQSEIEQKLQTSR